MEILKENKNFIFKTIVVFIFIYLLSSPIFNYLGKDIIGRSKEKDVISFTGYGEIQAVPNIASVYFTISKDAKTVKEAQDMVASVEKKVLESLKNNKIELKDIKTQNASFYPKYETQYTRMPCTEFSCPPSKSVIVGYTSSESITVKIKDTEIVCKVIQDLGTLGVTDLNGPNFEIEDEEAVKAEARKKAIIDAKTKASSLAKDLGVRLGKIVSFSESGNYPTPMMYKSAIMMDSSSESSGASLPKGENTITSNVTITYELR